jgi:hypothetical protein
MKLIAWLSCSFSDKIILPGFLFHLVVGDDTGFVAAASAPSPEFSLFSSGTSAGTT